MTTSWARSRAFSLVMMRLTWVLDVSGLRNRRPAISSLDRPSVTSLRVALGESSASPRATHPHRLQQVGRLGVLDQEAACRQPGSASIQRRSAGGAGSRTYRFPALPEEIKTTLSTAGGS